MPEGFATLSDPTLIFGETEPALVSHAERYRRVDQIVSEQMGKDEMVYFRQQIKF